MGLNAADYWQQLAGLLPKGPAWDAENSPVLSGMLDAWSQEFARMQSRADALVEQADPRITYDLLTDYERIFGLPTACMIGVDQSLDQRHATLITQMTGIGSQSRAYYIALAALAGFAITITEFRPYDVTMTVDAAILGTDWTYAWQINAALNTVSYFTVTGGVNEALGNWGNTQLECLINLHKPAHTVVIFSYT